MKKTIHSIVLAALCLNFTLKAQEPARRNQKPITSKTDSIKIRKDSINLDEVQIIGYGQTTKRLNTGSISSISAKQIENQPVTNVLSALSGRMPGVFVQTTNGLPGGNINIEIRGKGSILAGTNPLYIIDGVPFESTIVAANANIATSAITGAMNPLNTINPADIESITVLKDADATAIYGSRGSNGVILITTKRGKAGNTKASIGVNKGISTAANFPKLLNLEEYLMLRKEAFANDKITPTSSNAIDLLTWPQGQYTNWSEYLFGNTAQSTDLQASLSGGAQATTFNASVNFRAENNIISDAAKYTRGGLSFSLRHRSENQKLDIYLSNLLVWDANNSPNLATAASGILLPPNQPLYDAAGSFYWRSSNPLAEMQSRTKAQTSNVISNLNLAYALHSTVKLSVSAGYNSIGMKQVQLFPIRSLSPGSINYAQYGNNTNRSFIVEPQINFNQTFGGHTISVLLGGTYQNRLSGAELFKISNFSNEELMENIASASTIDIRTGNATQYKYLSAFSRATYNYEGRYILNVTIRRDGSSRFGTGNRFGNFGSIGTAWLFSEEKWFSQQLPWISFGKLRGSYGLTGNDQIPDYQFLSTYASSGKTYQGISTLNPARIDNADFHWESTEKAELALELGLFKNRVMFNANFYQNRSEDQLVQYALPNITGFPNYQANLPAVIENKGWEFELQSTNLRKPNFSWTSTFNLSLPKNKLISFENFDNSAYRQTYEIGYDISRFKGYQFLGLDQQTGKAQYAGQDGLPSASPFSNFTIGKTSADFFGGFGNTFRYKGFTADVFFQFCKQMAKGGIRNTPGISLNNYAYMLKRWQQAGDQTSVPKASTVADSFYPLSSANFFDASYIRFKNLSLAYACSEKLCRKLKTERINFYLQGQNLLSFWHKDNPFMDPESGAFAIGQTNVSPGRSFVAGLQITF